MKIIAKNANVKISTSAVVDFSDTGKLGYYHFGYDSTAGEWKQQGASMMSTTSGDIMTFEIPIKAGDLIENNTMIDYSDTVSAGLFKKDGNIRIRQIAPSGTEKSYRKIADIKNYTVTADDIATGADTLIVTYRISTQTEPFTIIRTRQ